MKPVKNISCNCLRGQFVCLINVYAVNICNIYHRNIMHISVIEAHLRLIEDIANFVKDMETKISGITEITG